MTWRPILDGDLARRAADLATRIERTSYSSADPVGQALLANSAQAIESAVVTATTMPRIGLLGGVAGVGWLVAHLTDSPVCESFDRLVLRALDVSTWTGPYDLVDGLVGLGVYGLARSDPAIVTRVIDHLVASARYTPNGAWWLTRTDELRPYERAEYPDGVIDFGMAHGLPGIVALLARCIAAGIEVSRALALLHQLVEFLLAEAPSRTPRFPAYSPVGVACPASRRVAWCYGDFGPALALLEAARVCDRPMWRAEAFSLVGAVCSRPLDDFDVVDPFLCHGATGVAHVANRLYQATGIASAKTVAIHGYSTAVAMCEHTIPDDDGSLLMGGPGIALALRAAIDDTPPSWDVLLLADLDA